MSAVPGNTPVLPIPSRRALLIGSSAAVAGVAALWSNAARTAPEAESLDAELIAICAQFEDLERQVHALYEPDEIDEDQASAALQAIHEQHMAPILSRMEEIHAQTPAGIHARARALAAANPNFDHSFDAKGTVPQRLLAYLMRDAMGLAGAASNRPTDYASLARPISATGGYRKV